MCPMKVQIQYSPAKYTRGNPLSVTCIKNTLDILNVIAENRSTLNICQNLNTNVELLRKY